ncbi:hypothetical protein KBX50_04975 [Micromonospora sp. C51]|uniref:hypothetical protein n=1 Tax=Micromonospora sp. C51 TaxID=2824879 RepID=UPI001B36C85E|nr:hypothetical protein [Micromonospora sp. C51]MBQ1047820.1 hypothetical protein [Micromonospora sp. C51]
MQIEVITLVHGTPHFGALLARTRADPELIERMWVDAECTPDELDVPGTWWSVAVLHDGSRLAAWAAARVDGGVLKCFANYEVPGIGRELGLYRDVYRERHRSVVLRMGLPAVTYLFAEPIPLHLADGWYRTGLQGESETTGTVTHTWQELRREPTSPRRS